MGGKYLGLPEVVGASKREVFGYIQTRVELRLKGWKEKLLSHVGKEVLLKTVVTALPIYAMSCFKLPITLCKDISCKMTNYWWGQNGDERKIYWVAWEALTEKKGRGGLGFKDLADFNDAMLAKQVRRLIEDPNSLVGKVLKAWYFCSSSILEAQIGSNPSWGWRSLMHGRRVLEGNLQWRVGDGRKINVWKDAWLPNAKKASLSSNEESDAGVQMVADLILNNPIRWNVEKIGEVMTEADAMIICGIPLGRYDYEDKLTWRHTTNGHYTVKLGYETTRLTRRNGIGNSNDGVEASDGRDQGVYFKRLWALEVPAKIKHFLWRCSKEIIPVQQNLIKRSMQVDQTCVLCNEKEESTPHLFFECQVAKMTWYSSILQVDSLSRTVGSFMEWWKHDLSTWNERENGRELCCIAAFTLWGIWKARNNARFNGRKLNPLSIATEAAKYAFEFLDAATESGLDHSTSSRCGRWEEPAARIIKINCDGAWTQ